ncbi:hypothetical protein CCC_03155 [Paramagnetospirillum magnetotacticum MS-1]|uniref:Uncharacterized protein n=1 Tax=Paramagnetospirillum magnetotacticum MS-1 TaxID=272627 RepID=A0A0C2UG97_PARME|nr:hypothetical protein [Paramagnetospirillum magnetotacticum]KIM00553.1 hypothetical protein CCC_03155 [Paramagnetospirillum magnetotacticum MS-1]
MKHEISAAQVVSARASDTGDAVRVVLADQSGEEHVVVLPLDQLALLSAWLEQAGRAPSEDPAHPAAGPTAPAQSVERWTIQPEADDEHIVLGFKLAKGAEMALRMHRSGVAVFAKALTSMLGRLVPAPPTKAKH